MSKMKELTGISIIKAERKKQQEKYNPEHDDTHTNHELALVAALYATPKLLLEQCDCFEDIVFKDPWPASWAVYHDKRPIISSSGRLNSRPADIMKTERIKNLAIAGALIAAEIDRLTRIQENDDLIAIGDFVEKHSKKPFQHGGKLALVDSFGNMEILGKLVPCALLEGCKSPVELGRIKKCQVK